MKMRIIYTILVSVMMLVASCTERIDLPLVQGEVEVRLNMSVEPEVSFMPETRGAYVADEATQEDVSIHNLWVLQFGGTTADALLREARYIDDFDPAEAIKLIATSVANRIILIANTFDSNLAFADCDNLGEFMDAFKPIADEADATRLVAGKRCPIMSAYKDMVLTESGASVSFSLKRCICKANITIINNTLENSAPDINITSVTICSVPNKLFFYTSYDLPERFPAAASQDRIDYIDMEWTAGTEVDAKTRRFTFYLPVNKCGNVPSVSNPTMRAHHTPAGASYLRVLGTYTDASSIQRGVEYRIPLGTSADDCNLLPGGKYTYTLTINDPSDTDADGRVAEDILVDFCRTERANTYIINPPKATGAWKNFRIPVSRVFDFWNPGVGYFPNADNALLPGCNGWKADILWSEFLLEEDVNFKWIKQTGTDYQDFFEFAIKEGAGEGNFVICLRRYLDAGQTQVSDECIWSWQMWVTDYNPNDAINFTPNVDNEGKELQFSYPVINGEVHRYNYAAWKTGRFRNGFIMDRNLGNIAAAPYVMTAKKGHLYYQHGRKDPLTPLIGTGANAHPVFNVLDGFAPSRINDIKSTGLTDNVPYSVNHPTVKLGWSIGSSVLWQINNIYSFGCYWGDVKATKASIKSIFDPCPPGWIVPSSDVVNATANKSVTTNIVLSDKVTAIIPGAGLVGGYNGVEEYVGWAGQQYCALYYSDMDGYAGLRARGCSGTNSIAYPVRCVTDNIVE